MHDLAPHIFRQRLLMEGIYTIEVDRDTLARYMSGLAAHLDLRSAEGAATLRALLGGADVFSQSYRPGALAARGFSPEEVAKLLRSHAQFPERAHVVGAYGLGKSQRVIALLREAGYERPIYLHGALAECCALYESFGVRLGPLKPATGAKREEMRGEIVLAPPSAIADRWSRRLPDPVTAFASGWMRVRARARQQGVELPLVISDHADWGQLTATIAETGAEEIWVTHGREDALLHYIQTTGRKGRALALVGREDEDQ